MVKKELILELGAEGGSICLYRIVMPEKIQFLVKTNESYLDDEYFSGEKSFNNLEKAVRHIYLSYPLFELYLLKVDPGYISPIASVIRDNTTLQYHDYDSARAEADDLVFKEKIRETSPENWIELGKKLTQIRELLGKDISGNDSDRMNTVREISRMLELVHVANIVNPFDWPKWDEGRWLMKAKKTDFYQLDTLTLCKLVTALIRNDRFCEGAWEASFRDGSMIKIIDAIIQKNLP